MLPTLDAAGDSQTRSVQVSHICYFSELIAQSVVSLWSLIQPFMSWVPEEFRTRAATRYEAWFTRLTLALCRTQYN